MDVCLYVHACMRACVQVMGGIAAALVESMGPRQVAALMLAYSFFGARNAPFYRLLLARAAALPLDEWAPQDASTLYR